jgi:aminoglycoside phosphotransferase (APT) family kinase protein
MRTAPILPDAQWYGWGGIQGSVRILSSDTVIKLMDGDPYHEERALDFVRKHTSIPVPKVHRCIQQRPSGYLVLEKIEGARLDKLWSSLSSTQRSEVVSTLRDYVNQLREASAHHPRRHIPGPIAKTPQKCYGAEWLFGEKEHGPFTSSKQFFAFLHTRFQSFVKVDRFDDSHPLVFTHGDLTMRNMIMGLDGKIWLLDWGWSGFYPLWFEYMATMSAVENDMRSEEPQENKDGLWIWAKLVPSVTGEWAKERQLIGHRHGKPQGLW